MSSYEQSEDAWFHFIKSLTVVGTTLGDFGITLKKMLLQAPSKLGLIALTVWRTLNSPFHQWHDSVTNTDLLPLPYLEMSVEDVKDLHEHHELGKFADTTAYWSVPQSKSRRLEKVQAWVFCLITVLNHMHLGCGNENVDKLKLEGEPSSTQMESLSRFYLQVDQFLGADEAVISDKDWKQVLASKRLSCGGEVVSKAEEVTLEQILPALPPPGIAGSIPAVDLVGRQMKRLLERRCPYDNG